MPQIDRYTFELKELAEILVKYSGVHEGHWSVFLEFGFGVTSVKTAPEEGQVFPAAVAAIQKFGILRSDQPTPLSVDAAVINPLQSAPTPGENVPRRKIVMPKVKPSPQQKEE